MSDFLGGRARNAAKWAIIAEMSAKVIIPITQMVLARILAPDAFGVLAVVIMVASFAEMLADAGFQKYLIQHEFQSKKDLYRSANVAFWASMSIAVFLFVIIGIFREGVAVLVGSPGFGLAIAVAAVSIPVSVVVSTQQALFRRALEYKKLLPIRVIVAVIPLIVSVPLALLGLDYWSLIVGVLAAGVFNAAAMTVISPWTPGNFFSFSLLKTMLKFSSWSLLEAVSIWATLWAGTFVVSTLLTPHELGLFRQPMLVVNSAFAIVTNATTPILFAALSRLQLDRTEFQRFFLRFQFALATVLFPIGTGAFFFREFFVDLLFGPEWGDASLMFGAWALALAIAFVLSNYYSEVFRSLGHPRVSFLSQCIYLTAMLPALYFAALDGFVALVIVNAGIRIVQIVINQTFAYFMSGIGFLRVVRNLYATVVATLVMAGVAAICVTYFSAEWQWSTVQILLCAIVYVGVCLCFPRTRALIMQFYTRLLK